jgi:hypothetical protein
MMVEEKKQRKNKRGGGEGSGGKKKGEIFWNLKEGWVPVKRKKTPPQCLVWFKLIVWVHSKMAKIASSTIGALVGVGSQ